MRIAVLDVTEGEDEIKLKIDAMAAFWGGLDVLVNNAGAHLCLDLWNECKQ